MVHAARTPNLALIFFFFNDSATPEISPLPLPDALPISAGATAIDLKDQTCLPGLIDSHTHITSQTSRTQRSEEHTSELQSPDHLVCRLLLEKKKTKQKYSVYKLQQRHRAELSDSTAYPT